jgi:putative endonuclease
MKRTTNGGERTPQPPPAQGLFVSSNHDRIDNKSENDTTSPTVIHVSGINSPFACHPERSEGSSGISDRMSGYTYWVYILASKPHGTLYIGVTNSLVRRVWQHKQRSDDGFTARYGVDQLVYFEAFRDITNAIAREKVLKGWRRDRKIELIIRDNPTWKDLSDGWYGPTMDPSLRSG